MKLLLLFACIVPLSGCVAATLHALEDVERNREAQPQVQAAPAYVPRNCSMQCNTVGNTVQCQQFCF